MYALTALDCIRTSMALIFACTRAINHTYTDRLLVSDSNLNLTDKGWSQWYVVHFRIFISLTPELLLANEIPAAEDMLSADESRRDDSGASHQKSLFRISMPVPEFSVLDRNRSMYLKSHNKMHRCVPL